jgi:hypothetical protein
VIVRGQVRDEDGGQSEVYEKTVTVNNVAPTANDDQMNTTELVNVTSNLLDNDTDPGNDTILADDGELDSISCGLGVDVVFVDLEDLDAEGTDFEDFIRLTSCETINEPELPVEG